MKTLSIAMAFALTSGAAQAGSVFEVPINGGIARILLDDNCEESVCASVSWTEIDRRQNRKEPYRKEPAKPSTRLKGAPAANLASSEPAPASGRPTGSGNSFGATSAPAPTPTGGGPAGSESNAESPAMASRKPAANVAPAGPVLGSRAVAAIPPPQSAVSAIEASEPSPVGEWLVEDGKATIRIDECANNLCGVVASAQNSNETDRKNPNPELRNRPIIGMPILLDMRPAKSNRWEGRAYNSKNGQTYNVSISLNNSQSLRVEGCVFGGFICGGQNWTRVN
jgi:uncharacterized protein (DUF2147 family)